MELPESADALPPRGFYAPLEAHYSFIAEKLDPEVVHQIMDGCFNILMNETHKFEGTLISRITNLRFGSYSAGQQRYPGHRHRIGAHL